MANRPNMLTHLREKIEPNWPASIKSTSERALGLFEAFVERRKPLNATAADYVPVVRNLVREHFARDVARLTKELVSARATLLSDREALLKRAIPAGEHAAEICQHLKGLDDSARMALLLGPNASKDALAAVVSAPLFLSGVSLALAAQARDEFLSREFASDVAALDSAAAAIEHAQACAGVLQAEICGEVKMSPEEFGVFVETAAAPEPVRSAGPDPEKFAALEKNSGS